MPSPDPPGAKAVTNSFQMPSPAVSNDGDAQLSAADGVPTSVSSVAIDRGLLGGGVTTAVVAEVPASASDADVMLRVKRGDESAFTYLVQKYRRQIVGFM